MALFVYLTGKSYFLQYTQNYTIFMFVSDGIENKISRRANVILAHSSNQFPQTHTHTHIIIIIRIATLSFFVYFANTDIVSSFHSSLRAPPLVVFASPLLLFLSLLSFLCPAIYASLSLLFLHHRTCLSIF